MQLISGKTNVLLSDEKSLPELNRKNVIDTDSVSECRFHNGADFR